MSAEIWTVPDARAALETWRKWHQARDHYVQQAWLAGLSISEIARIMGLSRTTIDRILNGASQ